MSDREPAGEGAARRRRERRLRQSTEAYDEFHTKLREGGLES